jgi:hypothetical protein
VCAREMELGNATCVDTGTDTCGADKFSLAPVAQAKQDEALKAAVYAESTAFFARDVKAWENTWAHDANVTRWVLQGSRFGCAQRWEKIRGDVLATIRANPEPVPATITNDNQKSSVTRALHALTALADAAVSRRRLVSVRIRSNEPRSFHSAKSAHQPTPSEAIRLHAWSPTAGAPDPRRNRTSSTA